jgi:hypothetical protein
MKTENTTNGADALMHAVISTLDTQVEQYSVSTQMRLNEARARAIAATRAKVPFWRSHSLLGAAFAFSAGVAFVLLTNVPSQPGSADIEATALYEATFGAELSNDAEVNPDAILIADLDQAALDEMVLDEAVLANDLEFYAWLSETTHAVRAPAGSGS